jgi:CBS domain-containing protein
MKVRDIMTDQVACCTPDTKLQKVAMMMIDCDCGAIPVVFDTASRRLLGIITDRDIVCRAVAQGKDPLELAARDCMSGDLVCVMPGTDIDECCDVMERKQIRRVPVVDVHNCCCGIVSQADIARSAPEHETAEVVREVSQPD